MSHESVHTMQTKIKICKYTFTPNSNVRSYIEEIEHTEGFQNVSLFDFHAVHLMVIRPFSVIFTL